MSDWGVIDEPDKYNHDQRISITIRTCCLQNIVTMKSKMRKLALAALFTYYAIQLVVVQYVLESDLAKDNTDSLAGLIAVNVITTTLTLMYILFFYISDTFAQKLAVLFDSLLFSLTMTWLAFAIHVLHTLLAYYVINVLIALALLCTDMWIFRLYSPLFQQIRSRLLHNTNHTEGSYNTIITDPRRRDHEELNHLSAYSYDRNADAAALAAAQQMSAVMRLTSNVREVKYMPRDLDLTKKGIMDGFRVNLNALPEIDGTIPKDLDWGLFQEVKHLVDSSSCHIYTAFWGDTPVILKLIKEDRITSAVALAEFDTEESVLSRVRHPHIVRLLGSGTLPRKYLVLEYLSGGTLSQSLGIKPDSTNQRWLKKFTMLESLKLAYGLAQALQYLHDEWSNNVHIIHRDLKPDNIGWSSDGVLKLFDFGLSVSVRAQRERTEQYRLTGNTGTLRYMAPEVVLGRSYHKSVDTYSFGILIWQVVAGKIPFRNFGKKAYFDKVVVKGHRPPIDGRWPAALGELLRTCWHEDKNMRPSFTEVVKELDAIVREEEEREELKTGRCFVRIGVALLHYIMLLRPMWLILTVILLGVGFHLCAVQTNPSGGSVLVSFAAMGFFATLLSFLDAWPLTPQRKPFRNFSMESVPSSASSGASALSPNGNLNTTSGIGILNSSSSNNNNSRSSVTTNSLSFGAMIMGGGGGGGGASISTGDIELAVNSGGVVDSSAAAVAITSKATGPGNVQDQSVDVERGEADGGKLDAEDETFSPLNSHTNQNQQQYQQS